MKLFVLLILCLSTAYAVMDYPDSQTCTDTSTQLKNMQSTILHLREMVHNLQVTLDHVLNLNYYYYYYYR